MTITHSLYHRFQRYRSLHSSRITSLPIVILMPHSACNCRCVMCDIWKDNSNLRQLSEEDIAGLLQTLQKLGTQQVLMSGGEALLNPRFFRFCEMLQQYRIRITLLSTGLTLAKHADQLLTHVNDVIVSLDGDQPTHDYIRNIPGAFEKMADAIALLKARNPSFRITARSVIHKLNFRKWQAIIEAARQWGLDKISFLPADVSSHAFNREVLWSEQRQQEILPAENELPELKKILEEVIENNKQGFIHGFIAEQPGKLSKIYDYYAACHGLNPFPYKKCNAPWVSAVVEADGTVRPCFFHAALGNIHDQPFEEIINADESIRFRKELDMDGNSTCTRCVCYLHLSPGTNLT